MRWLVLLGVLSAAWAWTGAAAAYQPAPLQIACYDYQPIPAFRGQAGTMPPTFAPGPTCCESVCCCCLHVWDDYCQPKCCGCRCHFGLRARACDGGQPVCTECTGR
jgi:hypothetical protein